MQVHAEDAELGQLRDDLHREGRPLIVLGDDGKEPLVDEATHGRADESLLLGQQVVRAIEIESFRQSTSFYRPPSNCFPWEASHWPLHEIQLSQLLWIM